MRVWRLGERQFGSHITIPLFVDGRDYGDLEAETDADLALATFIVDACNAAEQRQGRQPTDPRDGQLWGTGATMGDDAVSERGQHVVNDLKAAEPVFYGERFCKYAVFSEGGKMVREVTVLEGEAVPLAQGESLGPHPSEIGEQFIYGR